MHWFGDNPAQIAFHDSEGAHSYHELGVLVRTWAAALDIGPGNRVALLGANSLQWVAALYAIWYRGGTAVPLDSASPPEDLWGLLRDAEPCLILADPEMGDRLANDASALPHIPILPLRDPEPGRSSPRAVPLDEEATALILYTSGTSAHPKGVCLSFRSVIFNIGAVRACGMIAPGDRLLALLPFHHILSLQGNVLCPLHFGCSVCIPEDLGSETIMTCMKKHAIQVLIGVPRLFERFHQSLMTRLRQAPAGRMVWRVSGLLGSLRLRRALFSRIHKAFGGQLRHFISGGAPLPTDLLKDFLRMGFSLIDGYGMTEMGPLISFNTPQARKAGTVGRPTPGVQVEIRQGDEIWVRSPGLMSGYFRREDLTRATIRDGWLRTGDLGHLDSQGYLILSGRQSDVLILNNGKNIPAPGIESRLEQSPLIAEAALTLSGGKLHVLIRPELDFLQARGITKVGEVIKWEVLDPYNRRCPAPARILDFTLVPEPFPRTRLGKLRRHALPPPRASSENTQNSPTIEHPLLAHLQQEAKRIPRPEDHLMVDLGFDSLGLIELRAFLERNGKGPIPDTFFLDNPRVSDLLSFWESARGTGSQSPPNRQEATPMPALRGGFPLWLRALARLAALPFPLRVQGREHLVILQEPTILICNHQSYLDALLFTRLLKPHHLRRTFFLAKSRVFETPAGRLLGRGVNALLVDPNHPDQNLLEHSLAILQEGGHLLIFPEGTRSFDSRLGPFSKAFALLAEKAQCPLLPVVIQDAHRLFPRTRKLPRPGRVHIRILPPLTPPYHHAQTLSQHLHHEMAQHLGGSPESSA